jgi:hypothetical protein
MGGIVAAAPEIVAKIERAMRGKAIVAFFVGRSWHYGVYDCTN